MRTWHLLIAMLLVWCIADMARSDSGSGSDEFDEEETTSSGRSTIAVAAANSQKKSKDVSNNSHITFAEIVSSSLSLITGKLEDPIKYVCGFIKSSL